MPSVLFLLLASFWGGSFIAIKTSIASFSPFLAAFLRVLVATLFLFALFKSQKVDLKINLRQKLLCYTLGLFSISLPFSLLFWGEQFVPAGIAGVINGTVPIWTFITGYFLIKSDFESVVQKILGMSVSFIGVFLLFQKHLISSSDPNYILGIVAIFGMAISYGMGGNLAKNIMEKEKVPIKTALFHQHIFALISIAALSLFSESSQLEQLLAADYEALLAITYLGLFSTGIAYFILFHLVGLWGPIKAMSVTYLVPIMALSFDYAFFGNRLDSGQFFGVAVILLGVATLNLPIKKLARKWTQPRRTSL